MVVLPLAPGLHGPCWCRGAQDLAEAALAAAPHLREASPGEVRTVLADAVPDLNCKMLYVVRLDEEQLWHQGAHQVMKDLLDTPQVSAAAPVASLVLCMRGFSYEY